ncbi:MAG: hypothetical protein IIA68_04580 [Proteobacteria bacterium]|nr:hypothetical protein [Pseudomonadota bacterium]
MRTIVRIAILAACLAALSGWAPPGRAHEVAEPVVTGKPLLSAPDRKVYRAAFHEAAKVRFRDARKLARKAKERLPAKVIRWMELAGDRPRGDFAEVARFLEDNPEWPRRAALLRNAELAMPDDLPDERLLAWFEARPPVTAAGAVRHAAALVRAGQKARATALLRATWVGGDFGRRMLDDIAAQLGDEYRLAERAPRRLEKIGHEGRQGDIAARPFRKPRIVNYDDIAILLQPFACSVAEGRMFI